ncbi:TPA: hypothetical protein RG395_001067 [Legionella pneumophila]|nr:hypothetical protein [Legionella pneumophila]HAT1845487.1 hypothetical protein [Legionella pneumophila]HAT1860117.1 hypothetical protein [Legionella pneumophila]HAT1884332.1 hypothetical protein [Legionella pneumophila]HAT2115920.1 hypothetical protein [Legionella pneumophila]HAT3976777.1 hypothetical protein [Legionella pneumophila]
MNKEFKEAANELKQCIQPLTQTPFFDSSGQHKQYKRTIFHHVMEINKCGSSEAVNNEMFHMTLKDLATIAKELPDTGEDSKLKQGLNQYVSAIQAAARPYISNPEEVEAYIGKEKGPQIK